ncbi:hypothetical protein [Nocardioides luteus]|uniref:hypothetical protein n=1 Tax=Nocardioides luteus TaxID=1844 RepID=UPI0015A511A0|nr:hypothetical protein [Nocardioides luteus]
MNDHTSDDGRQQLLPLVPSVVGRRGNDRTSLAVAVAVAAQTILDVPEATQRPLAAGLLQAERLCADAEPDLAATRREAQLALKMVPGAVAWVDRLGIRGRIDAHTFAKRSAPTMVRCTVEGVVVSASPDCDVRLGALLEAGIAASPAPDTVIAAPAFAVGPTGPWPTPTH